jgi:hypothetical protein
VENGLSLPTTLFCDNKNAITMALHPANKPASRHIDMRIHFCRQRVELGDVSTAFTPTPDMVADFMTKQCLSISPPPFFFCLILSFFSSSFYELLDSNSQAFLGQKYRSQTSWTIL